MRDRKFQINCYQFNDGDAMARHMERMHAKGWELEVVTHLGWYYRRGEPERVRYAVTYFPAASVYDAAPTEGQMTYAAYCADAGWEFVSAYGPVQFFRSRQEDPIPIETDEREKLRAIHRSMWKTQLPSYILLTFVMLLNLWLRLRDFSANALSMVRDGASVWLTGMVAFLLLFLLVMLADYFIWYVRSRWSVARGGTCAKNHWRLHLYGTYGILAAAAVSLMGFFVSAAGERDGMAWAMLLIFAGACGTVAVELGLLAFLKRSGFDRAFTKGACIAAAVVLGLAYSGAIAVFLPGILDAGVDSAHETRTYIGAGSSRETTLYRDSLPLTLENLDVELPEELPYSRWADLDSSPMAWGGEYREYAAVVRAGAVPPELSYSVTVFGWTWLRDLCCERLLDDCRERDLGWVLTEDPRWGAEQVYVRGGREQYLLLYRDRAVTLRLDGLELADGQIAVIAEKLGK